MSSAFICSIPSTGIASGLLRRYSSNVASSAA
jgi:hypothetical protein